MLVGQLEIKIIMKRLFLLITSISLLNIGKAQEVQRPPVWGIASMTFLVSDLRIARDYYGHFLGFEEAFSYSSPEGEVVSFKVNDRQFLEFIEDKDAKDKNRLVDVAFNCDNPGQMETYLRSKNIPIVKENKLDPAGNDRLLIQSSEFYTISFIRYLPEGLHKKSQGKYMGESRIANRIHHVGLHISDVHKADQLYCIVLGFSEMWRFKEGDNAKPNYIYRRIPDCVENIEYLVTDDTNSSHPCFRVEDMQETIITLKERCGGETLAQPAIGKGNRWLLNLRNEDGTKVEFTESFTLN